MQVLFIGNQASTIILFRKGLIEKFVSAGYKVHTLTMDNDIEAFKKITLLGATPSTYQFSRSGINPFSDAINTFRLAKKIKKINPDVVFCFFPKPVIFGTMASRIAGVKNINVLLEGLGYCFTQGETKDSFKKKIVKFVQTLLYRLALPLSKRVMFLNNDDHRDLLIHHQIRVKESCVVGGIGVNLKDFNYSPPSSDPIHFTMVSRLLVEKGVREFVQAAKKVKSQYPAVQFSIAGTFDDNPGGITSAELNNWINEGCVNFLGQLSDIKTHLENCSIFVLPSYREGVPRSTQEAMAIGRAVITTDVPGCRDTVIDGVNGFLIPPWNVDILAEKMIAFIEQPELITRMGLASRDIAVSKFDEEKICETLKDILLS
jgi:glycosyltransferase involved in cell wall biosynthesis